MNVLDALTERAYYIVLVSSMDRGVIERSLGHLGVDWAFTKVVGARPVAPLKTDTAVFKDILSHLQGKMFVFNPCSCAVVGNSASDLDFAKADLRQYGFSYDKRMLYVQANWGNAKRDRTCEERADAVADKVRDLPDILAKLFGEVDSPA